MKKSSLTRIRTYKSLHFNAHNGSATGSETLYWRSSKLGKNLATRARGAMLLRDTKAPCVILEPFFGDNAGELKAARERLPELARQVARSVELYFNS